MIEAFRENGLNTLDHNTELHETRLEAIVSSIFYALNKRLPTTHYIDVERSISLVTNWLLYEYDRWDLLNCKKSSFKGTGNYSGTCISQKRLEHKENQTKYRKMTRKPWSHVRKLIIISSVGYCMLHGQANLIFCSLRAIACMLYYSLYTWHFAWALTHQATDHVTCPAGETVGVFSIPDVLYNVNKTSSFTRVYQGHQRLGRKRCILIVRCTLFIW